MQARARKLEPTKPPAVINSRLRFKLRIDPTHQYGLNRGLTQQTIDYFEAGLCLSKGVFSGRYVFPIHDERGKLIGYVGRSIDGSQPKYLLPSSRRGFRKSYLLFNLHRALKKNHSLRVVVRCSPQPHVRLTGHLEVSLLREKKD